MSRTTDVEDHKPKMILLFRGHAVFTCCRPHRKLTTGEGTVPEHVTFRISGGWLSNGDGGGGRKSSKAEKVGADNTGAEVEGRPRRRPGSRV